MINAAYGRVRQAFQLMLAWSRPVEDDLARRYLNLAEYGLYARMPRAARQHHLRVLKYLLAQGETHPSLLKAALLHDVGKIRFSFTLPEKTLVVLVKAFAPRYFERWSNGEPRRWRKPFVISAHHPAWSADMARAVGSDELTMILIRRHQDAIPDPQTDIDHLLVRLQAADNRS